MANAASLGERPWPDEFGAEWYGILPGDFLVVPAGQPHLTQIKPGSNFRAIVFKVRQ